ASPARLDVRRMRHVQVNPPPVKTLLVDHDDGVCGLYEVKGLNRVQDECRHPQWDAAHLNRVAGLAGKYPFIAPSKLLLGPGLEDRVVQVGDVERGSLSRACRGLVAYERIALVVHDRTGSVRWRNETIAIIQRHPPGDIVRRKIRRA